MSDHAEVKQNGVPHEEQPQLNGDHEQEQQDGELQAQEPEQVQLPSLTIRFPKPTCGRTVPKAKDAEPLDSITFTPQPTDSVQEIKLQVNDWVGAYWLGPYSLRLPFVKGEDGRGKLYAKKKDFSEVRAGEKLNEWMELGEAFEHLEEGEERVLEAVREPYGEFSARQSVLRLLELICPSGTNLNTTATSLGLGAGSTIFEAVRDGLVSAGSETTYEEVEVALPSGRKGKAGKKEVVKVKRAVQGDKAHAFADWKEWPTTLLGALPITQPVAEVLPSLKSIQISPFNPPPPHLRQQGHQLYLTVATLEGETLTIVCTTRGWYVSKSNVNNFDAAPRVGAHGAPSTPVHSLIDLLHSISPLFSERISKLAPLSTEPPSADPIATVGIPQAEPAYPFLAQAPKPATAPEVLRTQLAFLHSGAYGPDLIDAARDWNEEIQGIRELPRGTVQERVFREKMMQKVWSEFDQAAVKAVQSVSRGDIPPLNPAEDSRAHMYLQSNVFVTQGDADAIDAFSHLGGDAAMRISHAKDAAGVRLLNRLDVDGVYLLGHTIVDWQGRRWVCQSVLPGIFSNKREGEAEAAEAAEEQAAEQAEGKADGEKKEDWVDVSGSPKTAKSEVLDKPAAEGAEPESDNPMMIYGVDSEHQSTVHWDEATHKLMAKIGAAQRLAPHAIVDGKGASHEFYASAEVKGLKGQDGRRYLLDSQRLSPMDIEWLEKDMEGKTVNGEEGAQYPHRLVMLRPELIETFWESELKRWARGAAEKAQAKKDELAKEEEAKEGEAEERAAEAANAEVAIDAQSPAAVAAAAHRAQEEAPVDTSVIGDAKEFKLLFNPDAFVDTAPAKDAERKEGELPYVPATITDESDPSVKAVRDASVFLRTIAIPAVVLDVLTGNTSGIVDGQSLIRHLHGRGINVRYLGHLASTIRQFSQGKDGEQKEPEGYLASLQKIVLQEMVYRASKHILRNLLFDLQPETVTYAVSHFLNCLLGSELNANPTAVYHPVGISAHEPEPAYVALTPASLRQQIIAEVQSRFRWTLSEDFLVDGLRKQQLLREVAMRFGIQLVQREYAFTQEEVQSEEEGKAEKSKDKKKKVKGTATKRSTTFEPEDVLTLVPIIKSTAPSVAVAEEILDAGRATINRGSLELGLDFMLEAVQLFENIHSVLHPEVAAAYNQYASVVHQVARLKIQQVVQSEDPEKEQQPLGVDVGTALRLQRQAVTIAERTLGIYHAETAGYYFNLAMLENLEGNTQQALRYFRHVLTMWDVIYGPGHPEATTVLSNVGVIMQNLNDAALSLVLQQQAYDLTLALFGPSHIQTGQSLHQLTQTHFLANDIPSALSTAKQALEIFSARFGDEHAQTAEVRRNVELLQDVVDRVEKQKEREEEVKREAAERLKAAKERLALNAAGATQGGPAPYVTVAERRRIAQAINASKLQNLGAVDPETLTAIAAAAKAAGQPGTAPSAPEGAAEEPSTKIGEKGTENIEELVRYIQGQQAIGAGAGGGAKRGKNALRGKRRTGAKR
ncbi:hypothetical protein IAT38_004595 [Cryptococcus sp. DSM 104549]